MQNSSYQQLRQDFQKVQEGLRKLIVTGHLAQAGQILNMISLKSFEFDLPLVKGMPVEDLMVFLAQHRQLNPFQLSILAGLLTLDGEIYFQRKSFMDSLLAVERSLNIDFLLGYFKQLLSRRSDLKLIIASATLDAERFSRHFNGATIVQVSGRSFPVEIRYRPPQQNEEGEMPDLPQRIAGALEFHQIVRSALSKS